MTGSGTLGEGKAEVMNQPWKQGQFRGGRGMSGRQGLMFTDLGTSVPPEPEGVLLLLVTV